MSLISKVFTGIFLVVSLFLSWQLYSSIKTSIDLEEQIKYNERKIVERLEMIRTAQEAYQSVNGQYTSDWDKLLTFVDTGRFYIIDRKETIILLDYGADSISVELDTIGTKMVLDSIFSKQKFPNFDLQNLPYVPVTEAGWENVKFQMWADKITKSGVPVDVIEVWNPQPYDRTRAEDSDITNRKPLRFGSRTSVTTSGNWE